MRKFCKRIAYIGVVATFLIFIGGIERASASNIEIWPAFNGGALGFNSCSYGGETSSFSNTKALFVDNFGGVESFPSFGVIWAGDRWNGADGHYYSVDDCSGFSADIPVSSTHKNWLTDGNTNKTTFFFYNPSGNTYYFTLDETGGEFKINGVVATSSEYAGYVEIDTSTRIIKLEPETGSTTPTNSVYFNYEVYLSEEDMEESGSVGMKLYLHNIDQNVVLLSAFSPSDIVLVDTYATTSGYWRYSTTTNLATGNYRLYAKIAGTWGNLFGTPLAQGCALGSNLVGIVCLEANTAFTVVEDTFIGRLQQDSFGMLNDYATSSTATTTSGYAKACVPWSSSFDVVNCGSFLFIPDSYYLNSTLQNFRNKVATHFPVGYFTDFVSILATTSASSLTVIDAVVPSGVVGSGARVTLDLNGVLDPILYATTSQFVNESAPNTGTLYSITSYYWNIIVYVLTILYFVRRILGAHIIPHHDVSVTEYGSETVSTSGVNDRGERITKVHGITKRRKL